MTLRVTKGEILRTALGLGPDKMDTCKQLARAISEYETEGKRGPSRKLDRLYTRIEWLVNSLGPHFDFRIRSGSIVDIFPVGQN